MPTIKDIAREAGVSKTTVSRVLNNPELVNESTRKKVLETFKRLDYVPNIIARGMRNKKTKSFGIIIPDFNNLYYSEFLRFIEKAARKHGYISIICSTNSDPEREHVYIDNLLQRQVDGLILCWYKGVHENRDTLYNLSKKIPVVIMDQPSGGLPISSVYTDAYQGLKMITSYLIENNLGPVALIRGLKKYPVIENRVKGYCDALKEHGLDINKQFIIESEFTAADGYKTTKRLLAKTSPRSIVAVTDLLAIGALRYLTDHGYKVPDDIAVAGYDNIPLSSLVSPPITTVAQPIENMAYKAVDHLIKRIENAKVKNRDIVFHGKLIVRESTNKKNRSHILM